MCAIVISQIITLTPSYFPNGCTTGPEKLEYDCLFRRGSEWWILKLKKEINVDKIKCFEGELYVTY